MAAARKKKAGRQAVRDSDRRLIPGWVWVTVGLVVGLGLAVVLNMAGILPQPTPQSGLPVPTAVEGGTDDISGQDEPPRREYDFYTVLPEMEVVVPSGEIKERVARPVESDPQILKSYVVQVGSFQSFDDADQAKAKLAFQGIVAHINEVEINRKIWHRVRVGPLEGAREADRVLRQLQAQGYEPMVLSASG